MSSLDDFAIHGEPLLIIWFDLLRYSIDVDVTYIPIKSRNESFIAIHNNLTILKEKSNNNSNVVTTLQRINFTSLKGIIVKLEVSGTKRGIIDFVK